MTFEFATANRIIFGNGVFKQAAPLALEMGTRALVVTGRSSERVAPLLHDLRQHGMEYSLFHVPSEPTTALINEAVAVVHDSDSDLIFGFGGGSVIDAGKAIAALATNPGNVLDYLEVIGEGRKITNPPLPCIAFPTTAGTGAEVTKNAVLLSPEHNVKVSLRHNLMIPNIALIDPQLTYSVPPAITAATGLDALTQLIEPFVSNKANPLTDGICREGLRRAARSLLRAYENGQDAEAREDMAVASLFGGLALANAKLGAVHGFAGPLGGMFDAPHGAICARLLPFVVRTTVEALRGRESDPFTLCRFSELAKILTDDATASIDAGVLWLETLCSKLDIPPLSFYGMTRDDIPQAVQKAQNASSMKGNPIELTEEELTAILIAAL